MMITDCKERLGNSICFKQTRSVMWLMSNPPQSHCRCVSFKSRPVHDSASRNFAEGSGYSLTANNGPWFWGDKFQAIFT